MFIPLSEEEADAQMMENRLKRAARDGAFLILTASTPQLAAAEGKLLARFDLERRDLGELFARVMRERADEAGADWDVVLNAHNASHDTRDWRNLMTLVGLSIPKIEEELSQSEKTLLLVNPDVLAWYGRVDLLERLEKRFAVAGKELHGIWTLMEKGEQKSPSSLLDLVGQTLLRNRLRHIPECWITGS